MDDVKTYTEYRRGSPETGEVTQDEVVHRKNAYCRDGMVMNVPMIREGRKDEVFRVLPCPEALTRGASATPHMPSLATSIDPSPLA